MKSKSLLPINRDWSVIIHLLEAYHLEASREVLLRVHAELFLLIKIALLLATRSTRIFFFFF